MRIDQAFDGRTPLAATPLGAIVRAVAWVGAAGLLLLPAVAMRFTAEVDWGAEDFVIFGAMLAAACGALELLLRRAADPWYFAGFVLAVATAFVLLWANLAVGVIGGDQHPANAWFLAVFAVGLLGAALARLRARGMAWTLRATALAHAVLVLAALAFWPDEALRAAIPNAVLIALWLLSAMGFARAAP
jgi:hypothetical protein